MTYVIIAVAIAAGLLFMAVLILGTQVLADYHQRFTENTRFNLRELYLTADPAKLYMLNIAILFMVSLGVWLFTSSITLTVLTVIVFAILPWWVFGYLKKKRIETIESQLPDALLLIAGSVKAGLSLNSAIRHVCEEFPEPLVQEFQVMMQEQRLGVNLDDSLENLGHRVPTQSIKLMVSAMRIANETGGGLAEALERAASTLRSQHVIERKIGALTAQGKLQAWVVGLLPIGLLYILYQLEPIEMAKLWTTPIGYGVIAAVLFLEFFGIVLIRKVVKIDV